MKAQASISKKYTPWILLPLVLFIFILVAMSPVSHTGSDPKGSLLLSQALIENQSVKLDSYKDIGKYRYVVHKKNDHYYYYFPIGTSISSLPFVWFGTKVLHKDMNNQEDDHIFQKLIAGVVSALIFLLLFLITKMYFNERISVGISFLFWLGTSMSSTLGQALWSHDFAVFYALSALLLMLKVLNEGKNKYWFFLGVMLFMAYLTRPTMSLFAVAIILYLFVNNERYLAIKVAGLVGVLLGFFVVFSMAEFNQFLPDYYLPKRLSSETFWTAFYGNLFSPARGLFVYSPFLLLFMINAKDTYNIFKNNRSLMIIVGYIIVHLITISNFPHWWAGGSYGPRLMLDTLPAIFLLFVILLKYTYHNGSVVKKRFLSLFLMMFVPVSIYFNVMQGLYNEYSGFLWNDDPNVDQYPEYLFDWEYPQFLHDEERHNNRRFKFKREHVSPIELKYEIFYTGSSLFSQIGEIQNTYMSTTGKTKAGYLTFGPYIILPAGAYKFDIHYVSSEQNTTPVGAWDVALALPKETKVLNKGDLFGTANKEGHIVRSFVIPSEYTNEKVEIRNFYNGTGDLTIKSLMITRIK